MAHDASRLEDRLERLAEQVETIEARLSALEDRIADDAVPAAADSDRTSAGAAAAGIPDEPRPSPALRGVTLIGRTLLALAGAFLLRALTEGGILSRGLGVGIGLAYALAWLALADRDGRRRRGRSATFHGATGALVGYPLMWEVVTRFGFLDPVPGALAWGAFSLAGLAVAWRRRLRGLAWIMVLGATAAGFALAFGTGHVLPFGFGFLALGLAVLWVGYDTDWHGLSWPYTWLVDVGMFFLVALFLLSPADESGLTVAPMPLLLLLLAYLLGYLGSVGGRILLLRRDVTTFELLQSLGALGFGLGGAMAVHARSGRGLALLGACGVVLAAGYYLLAFTFLDHRQGRRANFLYFTSLALVFTLVSAGLLLPDRLLAVILAAAAVLMAWMGGAFSRVTLSVHCAAYAVAAALVSGLILSTAGALFGPGANLDRWLTPTMLVVLAAVLVAAALEAPTHERTWGRLARVPRVALLAVGAWGLFGFLTALAAGVLPSSSDGMAGGGSMAVLRTGILALAALLLALAGRVVRFREASWLVYPVLVLGGAKLLVQDLPQGTPLTLFLSLTLFGGALVVAPRLLRRTAAPE